MGKKGRLQNSISNLISGFVYRMVIMLSGFVVRTVFLHYLSTDYLGINGLYSNILSMLSLADLGFGTAMVYSMYKPLANKDYVKLKQLLLLYKKVYTIIGTIIFLIGMSLIPFLDILIKDTPDIDGLTFYYILFLLNSCMSYWFFAYRNSIITADQKAYIISNYHTIFNLIKCTLQIFVLVAFHNYTIYLLVQIGCTIAQNVALAIKAKKMYPVFDASIVDTLPQEDKKTIFKDVGALSLNRIAHVALNGTDSIIISAFVGIRWVGLLSNYSIVTEAITGILTQITGAITASLGNFFAIKDSNSGYLMFKRISFLNFWLYGFSFVSFAVLLNPFVTLWIGKEYVMSESVVIAIATNFFVAGFMNTLWVFRSTLGLFTQGKYRPLIVAAINIILSIGLSFRYGVFGVLIATSLSRACVNLWYDPWLIHRSGFHCSVKPFFILFLKQIILMVAITVFLWCISNLVFTENITPLRFCFMVGITAIVPNAVFAIAYHKREEFQYFVNLIQGLLRHFFMK